MQHHHFVAHLTSKYGNSGRELSIIGKKSKPSSLSIDNETLESKNWLELNSTKSGFEGKICCVIKKSTFV